MEIFDYCDVCDKPIEFDELHGTITTKRELCTGEEIIVKHCNLEFIFCDKCRSRVLENLQVLAKTNIFDISKSMDISVPEILEKLAIKQIGEN